MDILIELKEVKEILDKLSKVEESKLETFVNEVKGMKQGLRQIQKAFRFLEIRDKKAKVKEGTKWIYAGHTFPIQEIYILHDGRYGVYEKGSMDLRLNLIGSEFEWRKIKTMRNHVEALQR